MTPSPRSCFVELPTGRLHYREAGEGPPLLLLHANPGDSQDFEAVMPALSRQYRVLALDWPGYGGSDIPSAPDTRDAVFFSQVLRAFVDVLGLPPVRIIGNSVGGFAAACLAIHAPHQVAGLVLVSPGGFTPHNWMTRLFCRLQASRWALPPPWWARCYLRTRTPVTRAMLSRAAREQASPPRLALNRALWRSFTDPAHDLRGRAGSIQAPVMLVFGSQDPAIPARKDGRQARAALPGASFLALPCGHAPFAERPELFLNKVQPFLSSVSA